MYSLYIYYRVAEADLVAACVAARTMQQQICTRYPGLQTDLLQRPQAVDGAVTLMETYTALPANCALVMLQTDIEHAAQSMSAGLRVPRHVEVFIRP